MPEHISFSQLGLAAACGEAYRRKYVEGERELEQTNVPALCGGAFHTAVEFIEQSMDGLVLSPEVREQLEEKLVALTKLHVRKEMAEKGLAADDLIHYGKQDLQFWYKNKIPALAATYLARRWEELDKLDFRWGLEGSAAKSVEVECRFELAGHPFLGIIDQVFFDSAGRLVIRDLKTGKPKSTHALQLEQYRLALHKAYGLEADYGQILYVGGKEAVCHVVKWSMTNEAVEEMTSRLVVANDHGNYLVSGPFTGACEWCPFRPDCPYGSVGVRGIA